jgi:hypothetical protein
MIIRNSTIVRRHWFTDAATCTPTAQLYVNGEPIGSPVNGTGAGDAWTFGVIIEALTVGSHAEIWCSGVVGGITERRLLAAGQVVGEVDDARVVAVLPAIGIVADRSQSVTLQAFVGETVSQAITLYQANGVTPFNVSGKSLRIVFEDMHGHDVAVIDGSDITISGDSGNVIGFVYPEAVTSAERVLKFTVKDDATPKTVYVPNGILNVVQAGQVDQ